MNSALSLPYKAVRPDDPAAVGVFLARQPIFDRDLQLYAYELLYRSAAGGEFDGSDGDTATRRVLAHTLLSFGADTVLGGKRGFINFTHSLLVEDIPSLLPPETLVVEILENVAADEALLEACRELKRRGYRIALDDFVPTPDAMALTELADIVKIDFRITSEPERERLAREFKRRGIQTLAEKVETQAEFQAARAQEFDYFQGHFFARPAILEQREIPPQKTQLLRLLSQVQSPTIELLKIEELLRREPLLCFRLMRYVNSAAFAIKSPIESIRQALLLMGDEYLRKFVALAALQALHTGKLHAVVETAVLRARYAELIAPHAGLAARSTDLFLTGMFSLIDVMIGRPIEELLEGLFLPVDVYAALMGGGAPGNRIAQLFRLVLAYERAEWAAVSSLAKELDIAEGRLAALYPEAVVWSRTLFSE